ncbi:hypothetical protein [Streptomyces sp. NPDC126933]|uniref:hypothetical protein n=2 Tax=Streptomyces TaxID=1883 RepID=UPI00366986DE
MGLPVIASYPLPDRSALPASSAPWAIDPSRAALLVHDMQNHGMPVVFSAEPAAQLPGQRGLMGDVWGSGIGDEPDAAAIIAPPAPRPGEHPLANGRHNAMALRWAARSGVVCTTDALLRDLLIHKSTRNA